MIRQLLLLSLALPFGGGEGTGTRPEPAPPPEWTEATVAGLTVLVGPADTKVGFGGLTSTAPVRVAGGIGHLTVRQTLTREVTVTVKDADVKLLADLLDLPAWLRPKLVGRIGSVNLVVRGDALTLTATGFRVPGDPVSRVEAAADLKTRAYRARVYALGGLATVEGKLPAGDE